MTVAICDGSLFDSGADILVNPVNCQGVSGKGLALEFKRRFSVNNTAYVEWCSGLRHSPSKARPGTVLLVATSSYSVINFATKDQWRNPSQLSWIKEGLADMIKVIRIAYKAREDETQLLCSVAMPALGCGLGGLDWDVVRALIEDTFAQRADIHVMLYGPQ